jgi:ABC-type nitrate/sulfonate/bicarbonate transport system permease component
VLLLVLWQYIGTHVSSDLVIVPPTAVATRARQLAASGELWRDLRTSGLEFLIGFAGGAAVGIVVGLVTGAWRTVGRALDPFVHASYAVPIIGIAPLLIVELGLGIAAKAFVVALVVFFPTYLTTSAGVRAAESELRELGRAFRLSPTSVVRKILLPSAVPHILSGLRVSVGHGLTAVLAAELFGAQAGLGLLILNSGNEFDTAGIYVGLIIFAVSGIVITQLFVLLEHLIAPWRYV